MPKRRSSHRIALSLFIFSLLIASVLFVVISIPHPVTIQETVDDVTITLETPDHLIFSIEDCFTLNWDVSGADDILLNRLEVEPVGSQTICENRAPQSTFRIYFPDNSDENYTVPILVVEREIEFWFAVTLIVLGLIFAIIFFLSPYVGLVIRANPRLFRITAQIVVASVISLVIVVGVLEVALRLYFRTFGTEEDRQLYIYTGDEIQNQTSRLVGAPYVQFTTNPNFAGHNALGYRGARTAIEKPADTYRIVTIGASTTYGFGLTERQTYPRQLQDILREDYGYENVEVVNAGVPSYTSFEVLSNFQFRVLELDPDLIIYYGGKNDVDSRFQDPGCFNEPTPLYGLSTYHGLWRTQFAELPSSVLQRYIGINTGQLTIPNSIEFALTDIPIEDECDTGKKYSEDELLTLNSTHFAERNIRNLIILAQAHDIDVMVSEFVHPTALDQVRDDPNMLMSPQTQQAIADINVAYRQIAEDLGVYYYALGDDFVVEEGDFWTIVHVTKQGAEKQATLYARYLVENNIILSTPDSD